MAKRPSPDRSIDSNAVEVERLLRQLQQLKDDAVPSPPPKPRTPPIVARGQPTPADLSLPSNPGVWARVALGVLLGAGLTQWPYAGTCGAGLGLKVGATAVVAIAGIWAAAGSWRLRMAAAHITSLLIIAWGLALLTHEVIPRTRYWPEPAAWFCPPANRAFHAPPQGAVDVARSEAFGRTATRISDAVPRGGWPDHRRYGLATR